MAQAGGELQHGRDHPLRPPERRFSDKLSGKHIAKIGLKAKITPAPRRRLVEIHTLHPDATLVWPQPDGCANGP